MARVNPDDTTPLDKGVKNDLEQIGPEGVQLVQDYNSFFERKKNMYKKSEKDEYYNSYDGGFKLFVLALTFNAFLSLIWGVAAQTEDGVYQTVSGVDYDSWTTAFGSFVYLNLILAGEPTGYWDSGLFFMNIIVSFGYGFGLYGLVNYFHYTMYSSTHIPWDPTLMNEWNALEARYDDIIPPSNFVSIRRDDYNDVNERSALLRF